MKHIILAANATEAIVFDMADLEARLNQLTDTRNPRGKIYSWGIFFDAGDFGQVSGRR